MKNLTTLIQNGKTELVLRALTTLKGQEDLVDDATLLLSRWTRVQEEIRKGTISTAESNLETNKINAALLHLVKSADEQQINLDHLKIEMGDSTKSNNATPNGAPGQPLSASKYVWISIIALIISIVLFVTMAYFQSSLTRTLGDRAYYFTLFPLAFSTAAFLFGVMHSYAIQKGKAFSQNLSLGGPIVAALLVIFGGFMLPQKDGSFTLTVFVHGEKGKYDVLAENKGELILDLGPERRRAPIGMKGEVNFENIPAEYRDKKISVGLSGLNEIELVKADSLYDLKYLTLYIPIQYKTNNLIIGGTVTDEQGIKVLKGVTVSVNNQVVNTDTNGMYQLKIPLDQKSEDYLITFRAAGYEPKQQRCSATLNCECRLKALKLIKNKK